MAGPDMLPTVTFVNTHTLTTLRNSLLYHIPVVESTIERNTVLRVTQGIPWVFKT